MAEFTFKVKGGREDFRRTSVILLNSGASHPKVADDGTVTVRADRGIHSPASPPSSGTSR